MHIELTPVKEDCCNDSGLYVAILINDSQIIGKGTFLVK
jgi:hypothetical protein